VWLDLTTGVGGAISPDSHLDQLTDGQLMRLIISTETHSLVPIPPSPPPPPPPPAIDPITGLPVGGI
jgi:hypothetical protein